MRRFAVSIAALAACALAPAAHALDKTSIQLSWRPQAEHCSSCRGLTVPGADLDCQEPASCFVRRFMLVHDYRAFALLDPYLPAALLPDDWAGAEAARVFERYHDVLTLPAERYVREVCDAGEEGEHVQLYQLRVS